MSAVFENRHLIAKIEATFGRPAGSPARPVAELYQLPVSNAARDSELSAALIIVDEFAAMPENWDGYGASRIDDLALNNSRSALRLLLTVAPCPDLSPNPNGTISLEWETEAGYAVLEIGNSRFSFYMKVGTNRPYNVAGDVDEISLSLGRQISGSLFPQTRSGGDRIASVISLPDYVRPAY